MHRYKDLEVWNLSRKFCSIIYNSTEKIPDRETYGITNQMRRVSVSIPSNIAEGASRKSNKDFKRFLEIALGSCYEFETQLLISNDLIYLSDESIEPLIFDLNRIIQMTVKFSSSLNEKVFITNVE